MAKTKKDFKYSLRQCRKDVEIHKANGLAAALQADKTKKSGKRSITKTDPHHYHHWWAGPSPAGGQWWPTPHLKSVSPHFTFGPPVAAYIQYYILKMWPPFWFLVPPSGF